MQFTIHEQTNTNNNNPHVPLHLAHIKLLFVCTQMHMQMMLSHNRAAVH